MSGAPLGSAQAHQLRRAESRWLDSARDRLRVRPARQVGAEVPDPTSPSGDAEESR